MHSAGYSADEDDEDEDEPQIIEPPPQDNIIIDTREDSTKINIMDKLSETVITQDASGDPHAECKDTRLHSTRIVKPQTQEFRESRKIMTEKKCYNSLSALLRCN